MLWDLVRDFFVQHVFGGYASTGQLYNGYIGYVGTYVNGVYDGEMDLWNETSMFHLYTTPEGFETYISLADWLSTTATIITVTIIVVLCSMFIYKLIKVVGGLLK